MLEMCWYSVNSQCYMYTITTTSGNKALWFSSPHCWFPVFSPDRAKLCQHSVWGRHIVALPGERREFIHLLLWLLFNKNQHFPMASHSEGSQGHLLCFNNTLFKTEHLHIQYIIYVLQPQRQFCIVIEVPDEQMIC